MGVKSVLSVILEHELENGDINKLIEKIVELATQHGVKDISVKRD